MTNTSCISGTRFPVQHHQAALTLLPDEIFSAVRGRRGENTNAQTFREGLCAANTPHAYELSASSSQQLVPQGSAATGKSPAISYFGTEVISVVTTHGNNSSAGRKM